MRKVMKKDVETPITQRGEIVGRMKDYWTWAYSNLLGNADRPILAKYIVAMALGMTKGIREEWKAYDLDYRGVRIDVKASGYIQAWEHEDLFKPNFSIAPAKMWSARPGMYDEKEKRWSDIYVFCLQACKDPAKLDLLALEQWKFYVIPTKKLDKLAGDQKTISLKSLKELGPEMTTYRTLKKTINAIRREIV